MNAQPSAGPGPTGRLTWLEPIAAQIAAETGVPNGEEVEDLVIMAFEGLLNDPVTGGTVTYRTLLERARHGARRWATERNEAASIRSSDPAVAKRVPGRGSGSC